MTDEEMEAVNALMACASAVALRLSNSPLAADRATAEMIARALKRIDELPGEFGERRRHALRLVDSLKALMPRLQ